MESAVDISCIILFHAEDLIAHRTLRGIRRATDYCENKSLHVERVCVLDNATSLTRDIALKSAPNLIVETSLGDPGLARNAGVRRASGKYVAFVDGDDFVSANWLYNAYLQMEATSREVVLHPEVVLAFGKIQFCWRHMSQDSPKCRVGNLLCFNYWNSAAFLRRETCIRIPYAATPAKSGFGYEDWHWNTLLVAGGVKHEVVSGTAHFNRMKDTGSRWSQHDAAYAVIPRSRSSAKSMFSIQALRTIIPPEPARCRRQPGLPRCWVASPERCTCARFVSPGHARTT